jgi:hypothetical protein
VAARRAKKRGNQAAKPPPLPKLGTVVQFGLVDLDRMWVTRVEWVEQWTMCVIAPLRQDGEPFPLQPGSRVTVGWPTQLGYLEAAAELRGPGQERIATWIIDVKRIDRKQRRSSYRLDVTVPLTIRQGERSLQGTIQDLSEGGLRCFTSKQGAPEHGEVVDLEFDLHDVGGIVARARVVRIEDRGATEVGLGLAYVVLETEAAENLRRFVFAEQLRRRGTSG